MIVITGCGRSGTAWIARCYQAVGLDVQHEIVGGDGISSWQVASAAENCLGDYNPREVLEKATALLHQTRYPLRAIASCQTFLRSSWEYICRFVPMSVHDDMIYRCAMYWYHWNLMVETRLQEIKAMRPNVLTAQYQVERPFLQYHPGDFDTKIGTKVTQADRHSRMGKYTPVSWDDIKARDNRLYGQIIVMAGRYGYSL